MEKIRRGQIWFYKPAVTPLGHIQKGPRPVIIVSNDVLNQSSNVVLGVPCTSQIKRNFPTHVLFIMNKTVNVALTEQIMPINVNELSNMMDTLDEYIMNQVDTALKITLGHLNVPERKPAPIEESTEPSCPQSCPQPVQNPPIGNQVDKFYSRYPHLKPDSPAKHNKWTPEKVKQFISDYETSTDRKSVANKYNLTELSAYTYYRKFKTVLSDRDKEAGK